MQTQVCPETPSEILRSRWFAWTSRQLIYGLTEQMHSGLQLVARLVTHSLYLSYPRMSSLCSSSCTGHNLPPWGRPPEVSRDRTLGELWARVRGK